jgi:hypothetical protein
LKVDNPYFSALGDNGVGILFSIGGDGGFYASNRGKGALVYERSGAWGQGAFHFLQDTGADAGVPTMDDSVMTVTNSGNVGIGNRSPAERLDVAGSAAISGDALIGSHAKGIRMRTSGNLVDFESLGTDLVVNNSTGQNTLFNIAAGNVGIGTWTPDKKLVVKGTLKVIGALHITGGADLAEPFHVNSQMMKKPGMVVSIDPDHPGQLRLSASAYDRMVAGVISGAKDLMPGMVMTKENSQDDGMDHPVALIGRVWCWCDAKYGKVTPGDLLTTSETPGHAMKVSDHVRAQGAVLGKAMSRLHSGQGLVLALVTLQ